MLHNSKQEHLYLTQSHSSKMLFQQPQKIKFYISIFTSIISFLEFYSGGALWLLKTGCKLLLKKSSINFLKIINFFYCTFITSGAIFVYNRYFF